MNFIDTHCHLNIMIDHDNLGYVFERAWEAGISKIIIPGIDVANSKSAVELAESNPKLFAAVGIHPNETREWRSSSINEIIALGKSDRVVAIGEIGLDFYRNYASKDKQISSLKAQLEVAKILEKPVIIHCRQSAADLLEILTEWQKTLTADGSPIHNHPGVIHSFDDNLDFAHAFIKIKFAIGINGPVTYPKAHERHNVAKNIPVTSILLETDSPFLPPQTHRGKVNEPSYLPLIARQVSQLRNIDLETLAINTSQNAQQLFGWSVSA